LQALGKLVSDVAGEHGVEAVLIGGGSGRTASSADYLVRGRKQRLQQQLQPQKRGRMELPKDVLATGEVKGDWQVSAAGHVVGICDARTNSSVHPNVHGWVSATNTCSVHCRGRL
jgi:hypothetical protein